MIERGPTPTISVSVLCAETFRDPRRGNELITLCRQARRFERSRDGEDASGARPMPRLVIGSPEGISCGLALESRPQSASANKRRTDVWRAWESLSEPPR